MANDLVTIATYGDAMEAAMARNYLESMGIPAFLMGDNMVAMAWHLGNAVGHVKLQVAESDRAEATAALCRHRDAPDSPEVLTADLAGGTGDVPADEEEGEQEPSTTVREQNADRAFRGAIIGLLFLPLEFYVFWLLLKVLVSNERLSGQKRRRAVIAAVINVPVTALLALLVGNMMAH
jgi:hypothetical protein